MGDLNELIEKYERLDWNGLLRKDLGQYSLEETKDSFDRIKKIFDLILKSPMLQRLSSQIQQVVQSRLNEFIVFAGTVQNDFRDTGARNQWIERIKNQEHGIIDHLLKYYDYFKIADPTNENELLKIENDFRKKADQLEEKVRKADQILNQAQERAVKVEAHEYGEFFKETARKNDSRAKNAFTCMLVSIFSTAVFSFILLWGELYIDFEENLNLFEKIIKAISEQNIFLKLVFVSLGGYLISHFSKTYSAESHLYYLNTQRQNALDSHKQILDSIRDTKSENDKEIANAILLELTKAIFDANDTGYLKNCGSSQNPTNNFVEITKNLK